MARALTCETCAAPAFIMGRTAVFLNNPTAPRTVFYPAHDSGNGPASDHKAVLSSAALTAWAAEMAAQESAEAKRLRKPEKKAWHLEKAASYLDLATNGLASKAWAPEEGW